MKDKRRIFDRTAGRCHLCKKRIAFRNYGKPGLRGAWEIEHSLAQAWGGTNHGNNLYPACVPCNRRKGVRSARSARAANGLKNAPYSKKRQAKVRLQQTVAGASAGALIGVGIGGPPGAWLGAILGGAVGRSAGVED